MKLSERSLEDLRREWKESLAPKPGVCKCPVLPDGSRGFKMKCPVHGGRSRADFERLTELRAEIFLRLQAPASVRGGVKKKV